MQSCPENQNISEFNYENLRKNNLNKIKEYYEKVLTDYTTKYTEYSTGLNSANAEERENANFMMGERGDIQLLNTHLIDIKRKVNTIVQTDIQNILTQKEKDDSEKNEIKINREKINNYKLIIQKNENNSDATQSSLEENIEMNNKINYSKMIMLVFNVLLLIVMIIMVYYVITDTGKGSKMIKFNNV